MILIMMTLNMTHFNIMTLSTTLNIMTLSMIISFMTLIIMTFSIVLHIIITLSFVTPLPGNTKGGSITVLLTSCLTGLV